MGDCVRWSGTDGFAASGVKDLWVRRRSRGSGRQGLGTVEWRDDIDSLCCTFVLDACGEEGLLGRACGVFEHGRDSTVCGCVYDEVTRCEQGLGL